MPYHVTKKDNGLQIWREKTIRSEEQGRKRRKQMRIHIDELGNKKRNNWVNRTNAVFAWPTFPRAKRYAERFMQPAIVEFDCSGCVWCVQNHIIEDVYHNYSSKMNKKFIQQIVNRAEEWHGEPSNDLELWMQPKTVGDIRGVYNQFGEPLEKHHE